jgi:hypothetical protein
LTEEELFRIAEEETQKLGGRIDWFPANGHECGGASSEAHILIGGRSYRIPPEECTSPQRFRAWLFNVAKEPHHPCSVPSVGYIQLDLGL